MRFLECLKSAGKLLHGNNHLWSMMKKSSVARTRRFTYFQNLCCALGKMNQKPRIKFCLGRKVDLVQEFITKENFGRGFRVEYFPRIHCIAARPRSPKVHEQNERSRTIPRTNYLHVDVQ